MTPKVAIILPVYNAIEYIDEMLYHLYNSTNFPFKLIIIDGFSTDGTYEYLKDIEHKGSLNLLCSLGNRKSFIEIYQLPKKGLVNAINFGILKAGELDVYLTQVDVIHYKMYKKDWLEDFYQMSQNKEVGIITSLGGFGISGPECINGYRWFGTWNLYVSRKALNKIKFYEEK